MKDIHALIDELDAAAQEYSWERELGSAAIEKKRLDTAKAALALAYSDGRATDIAEVIARADVIAALGDLVGQAMADSGISAAHRARVVVGLAERLAQGAPYRTAIALVEAIVGCRPDVHDTRRMNALSRVVETGFIDEVTIGQWTSHLTLPQCVTSFVPSPRPTLREIADAYLEKHGTQFGTQSSIETTTAPESAAEVTSR